MCVTWVPNANLEKGGCCTPGPVQLRPPAIPSLSQVPVTALTALGTGAVLDTGETNMHGGDKHIVSVPREHYLVGDCHNRVRGRGKERFLGRVRSRGRGAKQTEGLEFRVQVLAWWERSEGPGPAVESGLTRAKPRRLSAGMAGPGLCVGSGRQRVPRDMRETGFGWRETKNCNALNKTR